MISLLMQEIEDTIASAGYKAGGRVGFEFGGLGSKLRKWHVRVEEKI